MTSLGLLVACVLGAACNSHAHDDGARSGPHARTRIVLEVQPLWGDAAPFRAWIAAFERANPDIEVAIQLIPNTSDATHQYYLTSLEGGATNLDVLVVDVVWVPEFARAGWIADLSDAFPPAALRRTFLPGAVASVVVNGRTFAVPWFVDVGLLYYRTDLVPRAPRTYEELERFARDAMARQPGLYGYVWQGRQYEGLTCNVFEAIWGHGGEALRDSRLALQSTATRTALSYLRHLITSGISPASVTSAGEEEARRVFQEGRAVFMRNWPYAWNMAQAPGSEVRGRIAVSALPTQSGEPGSGALGGWQLAVNAHASPERRAAAVRLVSHLTSREANVLMAVRYARNPARMDAFASPELKARAPFIASLSPEVERARPRPVTPYYVMLTDILQSEFSAAVTGLRSPAEAMERAQRLADHLMREGP